MARDCFLEIKSSSDLTTKIDGSKGLPKTNLLSVFPRIEAAFKTQKKKVVNKGIGLYAHNCDRTLDKFRVT